MSAYLDDLEQAEAQHKKSCPTCGGTGLVISPRSGCSVPCACRVNDAERTHSFRPETITDDEAELVRQMTPEEQAYLCGRLVEREGPDTPEDRAALFNEMRRIINERRYGSPYSVSEIRAFVAKYKSIASPSPREPYLLHAADWLCRQVEKFKKRAAEAAELEKTYDAAITELPDDPPGGYTLPEAVRAMRRRIDDLENALKFYADNRNYETLASTGHSRVETDFGLIARDVLHDPKKKL